MKLYVRLPIELATDNRYNYVLLTHGLANNTTLFCSALATYSTHTRPQTIDITSDIAHTLKIKPGGIISAKFIEVKNICTQLILETNNPNEHRTEIIATYLLQKPVLKGMYVFDKKQKLRVKRIKFSVKTPDIDKQNIDVAIVTKTTNIVINEKDESTQISFEQIGGLKQQISYLQDALELPLKHRNLFEKMNVRPPKGILLYGPPGTGKTMLAKAIANVINVSFYSISAPSIATKYYGESESRLRAIFEKASQNAPSILFIDEIDTIASKRETNSEVDKRVCTQLLVLMDGLNTNEQVVVIAATNMVDSLDDAVRRGGRFDIELQIKLPNCESRRDILEKLFKKTKTQSNLDVQGFSKITNGYSGADLAALVRQASLITIKNHVMNKEDPLKISNRVLKQAMKRVRPAIMREISIEKSDIKLSEVVGLDDIINEILSHLELSQRYKKEFKQNKIRPTTGILLYGVPGTGKTMLAKAIANRLDYHLIYLKGPELLTKYIGETQKDIRKVFEKAKLGAPTIIVMDEMDGLVGSRDKNTESGANNSIISQLLTELSELEQYEGEVVIIGTTNRPDLIDQALIRAGRFDLKYEIKLPNKSAIIKILSVLTHEYNVELETEKLAQTMSKNNFTCAHIKTMFKTAFINMLKDYDAGTISILALTEKYIDVSMQQMIQQINTKYTNMKSGHTYY